MFLSSKDGENNGVEANDLIEFLENVSIDRGIFLLEEARRMLIAGRKPNTNSAIIARNEACSARILEPQVPQFTLGMGAALF